VATDQKASVIDTVNEQAGSVIENELPTYRAISAIAILSMICGGLAIFTFADPIFYAFPILSVGLGIWAHRRIRRYPDMLTGHGLANAGMILGLVFGLASGTIVTVQYLVRSRQAERFARRYAEILKSPSMGDVLKLTNHPSVVKDKTSAQLLQEFEANRSDQRRAMEMNMGPMAHLIALRKRLTGSKDQDVHFVRLESVGEDDSHGAEIQLYAFALFEVTGPSSKDFPEKQQFALAILKARSSGRQSEWWVESVKFPYQPQTFVAPAKPVGDGHDHPH
jgi:hypothetical protein